MPTARSKASRRSTSTDDVIRQFGQIRDEIAVLGDQVAELAAERGRELQDDARTAVKQSVNGVLRSGREAGREALAEARRVEAEFERVVADRPIAAVAVAAGVGYLLGFLSKRS